MLKQNTTTLTRKDLARFMAKVEINRDTACWEWSGQRGGKGYGVFYLNGKQVRAHRLAFLAFTFPQHIPEQVCHHCDNPACVNPLHLFAGTNTDNVRDCVAKGRHFPAKKPACKRGHLFSGWNVLVGTKQRRCRACAKVSRALYLAKREARNVQ